MEHQPAAGGAGVDGLGEAHQGDLPVLEVLHDLDEVAKVPAEAVESPDHDGVTRTRLLEQIVEGRARRQLAAGLIDKDAVAARCREGVVL